MATIITTVDKTIGNYQDVFLYEMNVSFQGIVSKSFEAKITFFIPEFLEIYLGDIEKPVQSVTQINVDDGVLYTLNFGKMENQGIAVRIGFGLAFTPFASSGISYVFNPSLWVDNEEQNQQSAQPIEILVTPRYEISQKIVLPTATPSAGSFVYYLVSLQNFGDLGGVVEDIAIEIVLAEQLVVDTTFEIIGKDKSTGKFKDNSADEIIGSVQSNVISFNISRYKGELYQFLYRVKVVESALIGESLISESRFTIASESKGQDSFSFVLGEEIQNVSINLYGPDYALPNGLFAYECKIQNSGNQLIEDITFTLTLGQDVQYTSMQTGIFEISALDELLDGEYEILYTTFLGERGSLGTYRADDNLGVLFASVLKDGDNIETLQWKLPLLRIGVSEKSPPRIFGKVKSNVTIGTAVLSNFNAIWKVGDTTQQRDANQTTIIDNIAVLRPYYRSSVNNAPVRPGDAIRYTLGATTRSSHLPNPIFATILPAQLEYIGAETFKYNDIFGSQTPELPPVKIIENWNENGDTLVKFEFNEQYSSDFAQAGNIRISFDCKVKIGAKGNFSTFNLLNVLKGDIEIPTEMAVYRDANEISGGLSKSNEYAKTSAYVNTILFFVATSTIKKVRGLLDESFLMMPDIAQTLQGGEIEYLLNIRNIGNADLIELEVVDILPHVGDTGVILPKVQRGSQFKVSLAGEVIAKLQPQNKNANIEVYYSQEVNPMRFGANFTQIQGVNDWDINPPENLLTVSAVKVLVKGVLKPNEWLEIQLKGFAPVGVRADMIAYNSFAVRAFYEDSFNAKKEMLAIEPNKVGTLVEDLPQDKGEINGISWIDNNANGLPENSEYNIDDVGVVLYNEKGIPLRAVFTSTTQTGEKGNYSFSGLGFGRYYVRFFIADDIYRFTQQKANFSAGSIADEKTGLSVAIDINAKNQKLSANVGVIPKNQLFLNDILKVNRSARSVLRNVVYNQMLLTMKQEHTVELANNESEKQ